MTRGEFLRALKGLRLRQADFAAFWGTRASTVSKWGADRKGAVGIPYWVPRALETMRVMREGDGGQPGLLLTPRR